MAHRCGFYRATVVNTNDPENRGRIQVTCTQLWGSGPTDWIWPMSAPLAGQGPTLGTQVWIGFEGGDEDHPLYFGSPQVATSTTPAGIVKATLSTIAPIGYVIMIGQLLSVSLYPVLFGIVGTKWGGDGVSNFGMPDMRGRTIIGAGLGSGLTGNYLFGALAGEENHTLTLAELASHNHTASTGIESVSHTHTGTTGTQSANHTHNPDSAGMWNIIRQSPAGSTGLANSAATLPATATTDTTGTESTTHTHSITTGNESANHGHSIPSSGSDTGHNNMQPYAVLNWIVKT